ncbi:hypothetical protein AUJ66_04205 [Candidatus Desantisbacteria bacterium CG1_02_38_46]|uniref:2Fe-2S ferredoxin-type domain-containing protein n=1 Tax=Candidatus Desantisbacteria bacterium CG1_02_38_46 TaxID=1817893 RepID=A0A1J4SFV0_9BACT|nr:MAG: hypothetical protein AUJ66_04205 [Candidatus Desantisbacteria bacterium CG1_02_38_46]
MEKSIKVTFQPEGLSVYVMPGTTALEAAGEAGIIIDSTCGGGGTCGKCRIVAVEGQTDPNAVERKLIEKRDIQKGVRLACQTKIIAPFVLHVPQSSRFSAQRILVSGVEGDREIKPSIWKTYVELPRSTLAAPIADLELIRKKMEGFHVDIYLMRRLSALLRESDFKITCVFSNGELISVEKGDTSKQIYGVAFDIGTTTLVGTLLDLSTGKDIAVSSRMNPQVIYGDDVISRINYVINNEKGLQELHDRLVETMNEMIGELAQAANIKRENIYKITVAGNSTMQHLFLNITPESLGSIPFVPVLKEGLEVKAKRMGIEINPDGMAFVLPNIAGFVGGDTVAVMLATQLYKGKKLMLAIDIGTNGEIVLGNEDRLISASTAAGPAFEGARIGQGMRASTGAIEKVVISDDVSVNVIDNAPPIGICGTGLIDAVAEMLKYGIIDESGRILSKSSLNGRVPAEILKRIVERDGSNNFILVEESESCPPIFITQRDVRELQLAKGAIYAGIKILESELGIGDDDIDEVLLAGAFGNFIRRENARAIGLIPDLPLEKIKFIGNAASSGAKLVLLSENLRLKVEEISKNTEYIELSNRIDFQDEFASAMFFNKSGLKS